MEMIPFFFSFTVYNDISQANNFSHTFDISTRRVHLRELANRDRLDVATCAIEIFSCNSDNMDDADNAAGSRFFETSIFGIARLFEAGIAKFFSLKMIPTENAQSISQTLTFQFF